MFQNLLNQRWVEKLDGGKGNRDKGRYSLSRVT